MVAASVVEAALVERLGLRVSRLDGALGQEARPQEGVCLQLARQRVAGVVSRTDRLLSDLEKAQVLESGTATARAVARELEVLRSFVRSSFYEALHPPHSVLRM